MNKVICHVCGTSYPENAPQCPICGYAQAMDNSGEGNARAEYTYVKGGRFSKSNVRKRNQSNHNFSAATYAASTPGKKTNSEKASVGMVLIVVILLLAILAVVGYIAFRFFLPDGFQFDGFDFLKKPSQSQVPDESPEEPQPSDENTDFVKDVACQSLMLNSASLVFDALEETFKLEAMPVPAETTDSVEFISGDTSVVTVDGNGNVVVVGEGETVIYVTCGTVVVECNVSCVVPTTEPPVELVLNRKEITFDELGQSWVLYDGVLSVDDIIWSSDDNTVATIVSGKVVAVGNGDTTVRAQYGDQTVTCLIHCNFDGVSATESGNISEADGQVKRTYKLYNPYGYAEDVSIKVGESFPLSLVDEDNNKVTGAEWKVNNPNYCSYSDGTVKGLSVGVTEITATYQGVTYTCVVRVK